MFPSQDPNALVTASQGVQPQDPVYRNAEELARKKQEDEDAKKDVLYMGIAVGIILVIVTVFMGFAAWMAGARFDLMFHFIWQGNFNPTPEQIQAASDAIALGRTLQKAEL